MSMTFRIGVATITLAICMLLGCATSPADKQRDYEAAVNAMEERSANRVLDINGLETSLLSVGGNKLTNDAVFPELHKTLLLKAEIIGSLSRFHSSGQAAKWSNKFYSWCRQHGGQIEQYDDIAKGRFVESEYGPVNRFANAIADLPTTSYRTNPNLTEICYDKEAQRLKQKRDAIATFTVLSGYDWKTSKAQTDGIAIILTGNEIIEADSTARTADIARREREQKDRNEKARIVQDANTRWQQASAKLRETIKAGDNVATIFNMDRKSYLLNGMVVEVKKPLVQVQFPGTNGGLRWINIVELYTQEVPHVLRCESLIAGRSCLY